MSVEYLECCLEHSKSHSNVCQDHHVNIQLINIYSAPIACQAPWAPWEHNGLQSLPLFATPQVRAPSLLRTSSAPNPGSRVSPLPSPHSSRGVFLEQASGHAVLTYKKTCGTSSAHETNLRLTVVFRAPCPAQTCFLALSSPQRPHITAPGRVSDTTHTTTDGRQSSFKLSMCCALGQALHTRLAHFILTETLYHFIDEETYSERGEVTCPRSLGY